MRKFAKLAAVAFAVLCGPIAVLLMGQTQPGLFLPNTACMGAATSSDTPTAVLCSIRRILGADLPLPATGSLGGVAGFTPTAHQWINGIQASGTPSATQPAIGDLANVAADTYLGNLSGASAAPAAVAWPNCGAANNAIIYNTTTHAIGCNTISGIITTIVRPQGRLTLTANTPVMVASATAQSTLRYDCYNGNTVFYFDGAADQLDTIASCEVTAAMVSAASAGQVVQNNIYDAWWVHGGANRICVAMSAATGGGGGWSSDTAGSNVARGTGYSALDATTRPYITNKNTLTNCFNGATNYGPVSANQGTYLGTVCSDAAANGVVSFTFGTSAAGGGAARFCVWNQYNRVGVGTVVQDSTGNFTTATTILTAYDVGATGSGLNNRVTAVFGQSEDAVDVNSAASLGVVSGSTASAPVGLDSASAAWASCLTTGATFTTSAVASSCKGIPGVGIHFFQLLVITAGGGTVTYYGSSGGIASGLTANLRM